MKYRILRKCLATASLLALLASVARAQDDKPAADQPEKQPAVAKAPAPAKRSAATEPAAEAPPEPEPAVLAVLESHPTTPAELLRAVLILVDLERADLARPLLEKLAATKLDGQAMAALVDQFASAKILQLAANPDLQPLAGQLTGTLLAGAQSYYRDPERIAKWIDQLSGADDTARYEALTGLSQGREAAVTALIAVLADPAQAAKQAAAREMLVRLGQESIDPLLGAWDSGDPAIKIQVAAVLGQLGAAPATPYLAAQAVLPGATPAVAKAAQDAAVQITGRTPQLEAVRAMLRTEVQTHLAAAKALTGDIGQVQRLWHWDPAHRTVKPIDYHAPDAQLTLAARLARELYRLTPRNIIDRRLYLTTLLEWAKNLGGLDRPLPTAAGTPYAAAAACGADVIEDVFIYAVRNEHLAAAIAAAQILGDVGQAALLTRGGAKPAPLVEALRHPDRRLRFAALEAIMKLRPAGAFAGSNRIPESLGFFASSQGRLRALVGHPHTAEGQQLAGLLAELGYDTDVAASGRELFELATQGADYQLAFIHASLSSPPLEELLVELRRDPRSTGLPLVLVALPESSESLERAQRLATRIGPAVASARPMDVEAARAQVDLLLPRASRSLIGPQERMREARAVIAWLAELTEKPQTQFQLLPIEPVIERALYVEPLSRQAALVLGNLGTARGQVALVEMASQMTLPVDARQAAAIGFRRSVERHGLLLKSNEIVRQYDRYNAAGSLDAQSQQVLSWILDAIERKSVTELAKP